MSQAVEFLFLFFRRGGGGGFEGEGVVIGLVGVDAGLVARGRGLSQVWLQGEGVVIGLV